MTVRLAGRMGGAFVALLALTPARPLRAQNAPPTPAGAPAVVAAAARLSFDVYLQQVAQGNLEYSAQRSNVSLARAQISAARVFPDPQVTAGVLQYDVTGRGNPTASIVQLSVPLQLGGQRGARIAFAEAGVSAAEAELEDNLRTLRGAAAGAYIEALHARLVLARKRRTLASLEQLVAVNETRLRAGDVGEALVMQSRVEARQFHSDELKAEGEVRVADLALVPLLGRGANSLAGRDLDVEGDLARAAGARLDAPALVTRALAARPDLRAASRRVVASQRQIDLARANRVIDVVLGGTWQHNFATGVPASLPTSDLLGATVTVPLPFSRLYRGELEAAYATGQQTTLLARATALRVETEVRQAVARYDAAGARVALYTGGVLADAEHVLERVLYNYQRGGATLVEVLVAQRTVDEVYLAYYDALADAARAAVDVQQASGGWDVHF